MRRSDAADFYIQTFFIQKSLYAKIHIPYTVQRRSGFLHRDFFYTKKSLCKNTHTVYCEHITTHPKL